MLTRKNSIEGKSAFERSADLFEDLDGETTARLAMVAGDVTLILDENGKVIDGTADPQAFPQLDDWIGNDWLDTVTAESKPKVMEMLAAVRRGQVQQWREVNQAHQEGDVPLKYVLLGLGQSKHSIAIGRDMREASLLQQRLLQAQQSLERDYMRLRQLQARYRLLFEQSSEPVLIIENDSYRVREANPAAHTLLQAKPGSLAGAKLMGLFARGSRDKLVSLLSSSLVSHSVSPILIKPAVGESDLKLSATGFRQHGQQFILVRLSGMQPADDDKTSRQLAILDAMPDAFVMVDRQKRIVAANHAFVELVGAASVEQITGQPLSEFVGRPGIDLELIEEQLVKRGFACNVSSVVGDREGFEGEPIELSAVRIGGDEPYSGYIIRPIARRLRDLPPGTRDLPRSVEQLTDQVGRMSLKDIVRESSDLIEQLCIEAALSYTSNNRASAAEILGLSRQSLYSKLHRYGLGDLNGDSD